MRLALRSWHRWAPCAALLLVACSSTPKSSSESTTPPASGTSEPPSSSSSSTTTVVTSTPATTTKSANTTPSKGKASYSCFSYVTGNVKTPRHACMRTDDCGPYLEQAKSVGGIREVSGCANVPTVYCFHQVASKDEPEGLEVCQPTLDECKIARNDVVKAKMSVDSDCGPR